MSELDLDTSRERRTNAVSDPPMISSHSWDTMANQFSRASKVTEGLALVAWHEAIESPPEAQKPMEVFSMGVAGLAYVSDLAAQFAAEQARQAKAAEERAEQARREQAERERVQRQREAQLKQNIEKAGREHEDRVKSGRFLKEYRDPPTPEKMEKIGRTA